MQPLSPCRREKGQACVELAIMLPVLIFLLFGIYDFACAIRAQLAISNMSREGANLASRPSPGLQDRLQDVMDALAVTAQPLDMKANGMMFITQVQGGTIVAQEGWVNGDLKGSISSRIGTPTASQPNPKAQGFASVSLRPDQTAYVVEVFYNYKSLFSGNLVLLGNQLYSKTVF